MIMPHSLKFCPITSTFLCGPATFEKAYEEYYLGSRARGKAARISLLILMVSLFVWATQKINPLRSLKVKREKKVLVCG